VRFTYTAPQAAYAVSAALCVTERVSVQLREPTLTDVGLQPYRHMQLKSAALKLA